MSLTPEPWAIRCHCGFEAQPEIDWVDQFLRHVRSHAEGAIIQLYWEAP